jgi:multiple sugar transport system permease protein
LNGRAVSAGRRRDRKLLTRRKAGFDGCRAARVPNEAKNGTRKRDQETMAVVEAQVYMPQAPRPKYRLLEDERWLAFFLMAPALILLALFIAYPFVKGIELSVTNSRVGVPGQFVGLANFAKVWNDSIFRTAVYNTFLYTGVTTVFKLALGLWLAMLLNRHFRGKAFTRAFVLLPFIIPTVLSTFAWKWMFDPTFSVLNWLLYHFGLITGRINWMGDPDLAMISIMVVNIWRGVPFFAISLLAGLQTISPELQEAAAIDGAKPWHRFWYITWPLLLPVTMVVVLFSVIQTFADFQIVYVMTGGGPANATHLFATYAYQIGIGTGLLSEGAAISLAMFPILFLVVIFQLLYIRRVEVR